ncbi:MAG TPA: dihydropteroate synthase [Moraxellaceae bacterium]|nr:dihydropteroate synthase [Moraxellaceae bacterium]
MNVLQCGARRLGLDRPVVMGILNVTPDSFSDGGRYQAVDAALAHARRMVEEGAAIIDVGAESTRPGAAPVSPQEELDRLLPVVERIAAELDVVISVDTSTPEVMREAAGRGAGLINDVRALGRPGALAAAAATGLPVCLMHMQGEPGSMQAAPHYDDVGAEVEAFLLARVAACRAAGIGPERLLLDPGFGFGKTLAHNLDLMLALPRLAALGHPLLVGVSRKSMLGALLGGAPVDQRLYAGVAAAAIAALKGARIIRVHDVKATCDAVAVAQALLERT